MTPSSTERLVVVRAGPSSLHERWLQPPSEVNFDLLVTTYDDAAPRAEHERASYLSLPGWKIQGYAALFRQRPDLLDRYRYIALIDDDIDTSADALSTLFDMGAEHRLDIWQPSLTWDSYFSYGCFLANPDFKLRYSNYIEMMCPFFSTQYLRKILPLFNLGYETGIDTIWCRFFDAPWFRSAVIDAVSVRHTKPVGMHKHLQGFNKNEGYDPIIKEVTDLFEAPFGGGISYAAIDLNDDLVASRFKIAAQSWKLFRCLQATPMGKRLAFWHIASSIRHTAFRSFDMRRPTGARRALREVTNSLSVVSRSLDASL